MDKSAIEQIQQSSTSSGINELLKERALNNVVVTPDNFEIQDLEPYQEYKNRFCGTFRTGSVEDFVSYTEAYSKVYSELVEGCAEIFVDDSSMKAQTIFDIGTISSPLHQSHKALLALNKTSAYSALLDLVQRPKGQMELSDFIEDWSSNIQMFDESGTALNTNVAITGVRKITIAKAREMQSEVGDFSNSASVSERIEATQRDHLPAKIVFSCRPYNDLQEREFLVRIALLTSGDQPRFALRILGQEEQQEQIIEEFKELIVAKTTDLPVTVYRGTF